MWYFSVLILSPVIVSGCLQKCRFDSRYRIFYSYPYIFVIGMGMCKSLVNCQSSFSHCSYVTDLLCVCSSRFPLKRNFTIPLSFAVCQESNVCIWRQTDSLLHACLVVGLEWMSWKYFTLNCTFNFSSVWVCHLSLW